MLDGTGVEGDAMDICPCQPHNRLHAANTTLASLTHYGEST